MGSNKEGVTTTQNFIKRNPAVDAAKMQSITDENNKLHKKVQEQEEKIKELEAKLKDNAK
jgi:uncharacterized protein YlxW (UPF0749 family)